MENCKILESWYSGKISGRRNSTQHTGYRSPVRLGGLGTGSQGSGGIAENFVVVIGHLIFKFFAVLFAVFSVKIFD